MKTKKLKPFVIPVLYGVVTISLLASLMFLVDSLLKIDNNPLTYITSGTLVEEIVPVVGESKKFVRPYIDKNVKILQNYYDYKGDKETQEKSLIYYENTYLQNSGVDYGKEEEFDIISIYDGTVINVKEDNLLGNIIEIQHTNNIIGSYQCLKDISMSKGDSVSQGQKIGTSSTCNINKTLPNHLHLEIINKGEFINPETIYDKLADEV